MLKMIYCEDCESTLRSYGECVFACFHMVCWSYHNGSPLEVSAQKFERTNGDLSIGRFLESKGYVISTENGLETILLKPMHTMVLDEEDSSKCRFCMHDY
jgi:hypothetical protein